MLSILIPIYNKNIIKLVNTLSKQCHKAKINFEILCFDDKSRKNYREANIQVNSIFGVNYVNLSENLGRSKIRNRLARTARFDNLLFLDCDSIIPNAKFIKNYMPYADKIQLTYGGTAYKKREPKTIKKKLHWRYGTQREAINAKKRNKNPYQDFRSNNFMIHRSLMKQIAFDENITTYGYEDTILAESLKNKGFKIFHIDNAVIHNGLENNDIFIDKTKSAIKNLATLYKSKKVTKTRLINIYEILNIWKMDKLVYRYLSKKETSYLENINSINPSIRTFNLWKLKLFMDEITRL
jgi:hypothetical protein